MEAVARVVSTSGGTVRLDCIPDLSCGSCGSSPGCGLHLSGRVRRSFLDVPGALVAWSAGAGDAGVGIGCVIGATAGWALGRAAARHRDPRVEIRRAIGGATRG